MASENKPRTPEAQNHAESQVKSSNESTSEPVRWRVGRSTKRTIWYGDDVVHGMVDSPAIASRICEALNVLGDYRSSRAVARAAPDERLADVVALLMQRSVQGIRVPCSDKVMVCAHCGAEDQPLSAFGQTWKCRDISACIKRYTGKSIAELAAGTNAEPVRRSEPGGTFACPLCREQAEIGKRFYDGAVAWSVEYMMSTHRHDECVVPVAIPRHQGGRATWKNDDGRWFRFCGVIAKDGMGYCDAHRPRPETVPEVGIQELYREAQQIGRRQVLDKLRAMPKKTHLVDEVYVFDDEARLLADWLERELTTHEKGEG